MYRALWHYTKGLRMPSILADGQIKPSTKNVPAKERIAWFSMDQTWERTIFCVDVWNGASMEGLSEFYKGLYRIGVDPATAPLNWEELKRLAGMSSRTANMLVKNAKRVHADPRNWRGTFEPVPRSLWLVVEMWDSGKWIDAPQ